MCNIVFGVFCENVLRKFREIFETESTLHNAILHLLRLLNGDMVGAPSLGKAEVTKVDDEQWKRLTEAYKRDDEKLHWVAGCPVDRRLIVYKLVQNSKWIL